MNLKKRVEKVEQRVGVKGAGDICTMTPSQFRKWLLHSSPEEREHAVAILEQIAYNFKPMKFLLPDELKANLELLKRFFAISEFQTDPEAALKKYVPVCEYQSSLRDKTPDEIRATIAAMDREIAALEAELVR
jgi:hypothetical protein